MRHVVISHIKMRYISSTWLKRCSSAGCKTSIKKGSSGPHAEPTTLSINTSSALALQWGRTTYSEADLACYHGVGFVFSIYIISCQLAYCICYDGNGHLA